MSSRTELEWEILAVEWDMFHSVSRHSDLADLLKDHQSFSAMRRCQLAPWNEHALTSYLSDLHRAARAGRNLMSEKYARVPETTPAGGRRDCVGSPRSFDGATARMVDEIVDSSLAWKEAIARRSPRHHPSGEAPDAGAAVDRESLEAALRAELRTFSPRTIVLLHRSLRRRNEDTGAVIMTLLSKIRDYGFTSLEEVERYFQGRVTSPVDQAAGSC